MVNPSTLAAAGAVAAAVETFAEVTGAAGRAAAQAAPAPASRAIPLLLDPDFIRTMGRVFTTLSARRSSASVAGWAPAPSAAKKTSSSSKTSATSFLSDPKLSIEEKLMRLLAYLSDKWEKQMQAKLDQINADEANTADGGTSGSTTKKSDGGGLLGGLGGILGGVLGGGGGGGLGDLLGGVLGSGGGGGIGAMLGKVFEVLQIPGVTSILGKIGGPVLAAAASALGFPAAAPAILQAAPAVFEAAGGVASSVGGSGAGASGGSSGSGATSGKSSGKMSDSQRQLLVMEIQRIYERQKEMFNLVSNILKSGHDTRMGVIHNVRG